MILLIVVALILIILGQTAFIMDIRLQIDECKRCNKELEDIVYFRVVDIHDI